MKALLALEPRILFDGAAFVTGAEVAQDQTTQDQPDPDINANTKNSSGENIATDHDAFWASGLSLATPADRREMVFIDTRVENYTALMDGIDPATEVILLDARRDGIEQIAEALKDRSDIDAIHLIGEGTESEMHLGTAFLTQEAISGRYANLFTQIGQSLSADADLLIYGCNFGRGQAGLSAMQTIAQLTGADIAASTDRTGHINEYANWQLEVSTGFIETSIVIGQATQDSWEGVLATYTVTTTADGGAGSLRQAILDANANSGTDSIIFVGSGTYLLTITGTGENSAVTGDLDITESLTITGNGVGNTIIDGGGIDRIFDVRSSSVATISNLTVQGGNSSSGGGISVDSGTNVTLSNVIVSGNTTSVGGGGISNKGTLTLTDTAISGNSAVWGGGIYNESGVVTLNRVTIGPGNTATNDGGGIYNFGVGAGLSLTNVTITGNSAGINGGGIWTNRTVDITNSTIAFNTNGGGIYGSGAQGTPTLKNTILDNNTGGNANKALTSLGNNIDSDGTAGLGDPLDGQDPMLGALADNGGPTKTHALLVGSPGIDAGTAVGAPPTDQRGVSRVGNVDIGAFEFTSTNQAPVNVVPVAQTTNQDSTLVFSSGTSNQISISDPDAGSSEVEVTLTATNGTVTLAGTAGLTFSIGDGTGDTTMTFTGTVAAINTALNGLMFDPTTSYTGPASVDITTRDQGNSGAAPLDGDANITTKYTFDVDGTDVIGINDATLNNGAAIVTDGERGNVLSTDGINDYARVPAAATNGLAQFTFSFWVKTTESRTNATYYNRPTLFGMELAGFGNNDLALNTNNGFIGFWTGLAGAGDGNYLSTTTQINDNQWHQITVSNNGASASLYVDGVLETSLATGNGLANSAFFIGALNNSGAPGRYHSGFFDDVRIFNRSLTSQEANDLYSLSDTDNVAITVSAAPTLDLDANDSSGATGNDYQFTFTEGDGPTAIADTDTDVVDPDSTTFASVKLAVTGLLDGNAETLVLDGDTFALATANAGQDTTGGNYRVVIATGAGTATVTITKQGGGTFTEAETETLIEAVQYQHTDTSTPTDGNRLIDIIVNDGSADSAPARTTINVNPVNDQPTFAGLDNAPTFTEGGTPAVLDGNVTIADPELDAADNYNGATLTLVRNGGANAEDIFGGSGTLNTLTESGSLVVGGTIIGTVTTNGGGTLVLTFNGNATTALVNSALQQLTYANNSFTPPASVQINFTINDGNSGGQGGGGALNGSGSVTVTILATNTAPAFSGLDNTPTFTEGGLPVVLDNNAIIADPELDAANNYNGAILNLVRNGGANAEDLFNGSGTLLPLIESGNVVVGITNIGTVTTNSGGTLVLTFNGNATTALVNSALQQLTYANNSPTPPASVQIDFTIDDGNAGAQGSGGALTSTGSITVGINAINTPPVAVLDVFVVNEGSTNTLNLAGNDIDLDDGLDLTSITIISGPTNGTISGINPDGTVEYLHNGSETLSDSFTYTINDLAGATSNTVTVSLNVTPVNDSPTLRNVPLALNPSTEDTGFPVGAVGTLVSSLVDLDTIPGGHDNVTDPDSGALTGMAVTQVDETNGSWLYSTDNGVNWLGLTGVNPNAARLLAADGATRLYFHPNPDFFGTVLSGITFRAWDQVNGSNGAIGDTTPPGGTSGFSPAQGTAAITINPVGDAPIITSDGGGASATVTVLEGSTVVTDVNASDADGDILTYSIIGGADAARFNIDPSTGVLTFLTAPDFRTPGDVGADNVYDVIVQASDGTAVDTQALAVTVTPANVAPPIFNPSPPDSPPSSDPPPRETGGEAAEDQAPVNGGSLDPGSPGQITHGGQGFTTTGAREADTENSPGQYDVSAKQEGEERTGTVEMMSDIMGFLQKPFDITALKSEIRSLLHRSGFLQGLDRVRDDVQEVTASEKTFLASSIAVSTGLSIGYVVWLLRSGVLLTALLSSVPAWQFVNPLLVLDSAAKKNRQKEQKDVKDDSVESLFEKSAAATGTSEAKTGDHARHHRARWFGRNRP